MAGHELAKPKKKSLWRRYWDRKIPPIPKQRQISPEYEAGFLSKLTFSWMGPLMATGFRRPLKVNDIPLLNPERRVQDHSFQFNTHFAEAITSEKIKYPLFNALHSTFAREFWIGGLFRLMADLFTVASPYTLRYLIQFAQDSYTAFHSKNKEQPPPLARGIGLLVGIIVMQVLLSLFQNHFLYRGQMVGGEVRAVLTATILEKSMKISGRARAGGICTPKKEDAKMTKDGIELEDLDRRLEQAKGIDLAEAKKSDFGAALTTPPDDDKQQVSWFDDDDSLPSSPADSHRENMDIGEILHEQGWSNGRVINLVSTDAHRIDQCISMFHVVWTSPVIILICMALLIVNLSYSALSGLGCLIFAMVILVLTVKSLFARRQDMNVVIDDRVGLTQEVLQAIRLVKFFSWEESFIERLIDIRSVETKQLQRFMAIRNVVTALGQGLPVLSAMVSFVTFALGSGRQLDVAVVFSSVALFSSLLLPSAYLPGCLGQASDAWASLQRIEEYLLAEEITDLDVNQYQEDAVRIEDAEFTWERTYSSNDTAEAAGSAKDSKKSAQSGLASGATTLVHEDSTSPFIIPSLSLNVRRGELLAVIGGIGSGKTSLLSALAGDMRKVRGSLAFASDRALCPQTAWIQNATVRDNILFGAPYRPGWYDTVITTCQLRRDLQILSRGDATEIGERGTNLSGGQKQRISLARAMYSKADILLLDDPLSAVDPYVGRAIFEGAILGAMRGKTRIMATHQSHVLSRCDRILWLEGGRVKALGTYEQLKAEIPEFGNLVKNEEGPLAAVAEKKKKDEEKEKRKSKIKDAETAALEQFGGDDALPILMQAEDQGEAGIPWAVYKSYIAAARHRLPVIMVLPLLVMAQGGSILCGLWLAWWASDRFHLSMNAYVGIYVSLAVMYGLLLYCFGVCVAYVCTSSSNAMLDQATERIMRAPVWFFDTTPLGRITNRFSKDIDVMDYTLPEALRLFMVSSAMITSIFALIVYYFHWFGIALAPLTLVFIFSAAYYRASAREIKRHEAVLRGVVVARFSEALAGVLTIRTYSMQVQFSRLLQVAIDDMNSANFLTFSNQRWLAVRLDFVGILLIITSGVLVVIERYTQSPAISGLVLSYALGALQVLQFIVRQWADVENAMNATERIWSYGPEGNIPTEGENGKEKFAPEPSWPEQGAIEFSDVYMRYRPGLPEVLRGFNLSVKPGEHVAIVGRTGAGKSSLIGALFRVCELSGGCVSIDGLDISQIPLSDLRSRLSIQPQDSILFAGSVRSNLDPFFEHTDEELWLALRGAWLANTVHLDDTVEEEGANFSHGQRQQLGLARLLVRDSKIVVCDEATSSVDLETDDKIQKTMTESFRGKTVLTVAHRIRTIINYDRVCVMEQGRIAELGTPRELWEQGGIFRGMCDTSKISESEL